MVTTVYPSPTVKVDENDNSLKIAESKSYHCDSKPLSLKRCCKLMKLEPEQASMLPYPISSIVWYTCNGEMAAGQVKSISMGISDRKLYYEINSAFKSEDSDSEIVSHDGLICFGAGCPVHINMNATLPSSDYQVDDGRILHGKVQDNGTLVYTVMISVRGEKRKKRFKIEENVQQERISYRAVCVAADIDGNFESLDLTSCNELTIPSLLEVDSFSSCKNSQPTATSDHGSNLTSAVSIGKKRLGHPLKDDTKRSRPLLKDVSNTCKVDGGNAITIMGNFPTATPKCDYAENQTKSEEFRIGIPSRLLKDRDSQMRLYAHLTGDTALRKQGFPICIKGKGADMYILTYAAQHSLNHVKTMIKKSLSVYTDGKC